MKKTAIFCLLLLLTVGVLFAGCSSSALPKDLYVEAADKEDIPAGEYTLEYTINKYEDYRSLYSLSVSVHVYDENNEKVDVKNNRTVTVEADKTYAAVISVYGVADGKQQVVVGQYTFSTVKTPRLISCLQKSGEIITQFRILYDTDLPLTALPEIPDVYPATTDGTVYTQILSKKWVILDGASYVDLPEGYLDHVTQDKQIYAEYEYYATPVSHTIYLEENGGNEVPDYHGNSTTVPPIQPAPTREGYTFLGWCTDEECTVYYSWLQAGVLTRDVTLFAKWVKNVDSHAPYALFTIEKKTDANGNGYCVLAARDPANLTGDLILPNQYDGLPIRYLAERAFEKAEITSVYIPNTYLMDNQSAFRDCKKLETVTFEEGNVSTVIASRCFSQCVLLSHVNLPNTVTRFMNNAFANCLSLTNIRLPENLVFINDGAFYGCSGLTEITLPQKTERILPDAFANCSSLAELYVANDTMLYAVDDTAFDNTALGEVILPVRLRSKNFVFGEATVLYQ